MDGYVELDGAGGPLLITACYSVYNCSSTLAESIENIIPYVDRVVLVDGVCLELWWQTHCSHDPPPKNGASTDGTIQLIEKIQKYYKKKIVFYKQTQPWQHEVEKRNKTLELAKGSDYYLTVDGDCVYTGDVEGGLEDIMQSGKCGEFKIRWRDGSERYWLWMYRHVPGIHYCRVHTMLFDENHVPLPQPFGVYRTDKFMVRNGC